MTDRPKFPSEAADRFQVRLPAGLREQIKADAEAAGRSMNAEIVMRLEAPAEQRAIDEVLGVLRSIDARLRALEARR